MKSRRPALVLAIYVAAAIVLTWPLAISLTSRLGALQGPGDPYLNLWILGWGLRAWTTDPASVFSGRVFDANIFHPAENTLAYSDHFLLQALALAPVYAVSQNAVLCYNLLVIGSIAVSGLAMHALARAVTGSGAAALVAGLAWACWPYRTAHLQHVQLQALYFMPLALLCLHRVAAKRRWRDAGALALVLALQVSASVYYGVMTALTLVLSGAGLALATGQWRARALWSRLAAAGLLAFLLSLPLILPYIRSQQREGFGRTLYEASNHSASWRSYAQAPPVNLLYGRTGLLHRSEPPAAEARDRRGVEHQLFPGLVLLALAGVGALRHIRSDARPLALSALILVGAGAVLSLGPEGIRPLYAALHDNVYGFQAIRAPARFAVIAILGLALLAALGMRSLVGVVEAERGTARESGSLSNQERKWRAASAVPVIIALLCIEYLNAPLPLVAAPPRVTAVGQWLAREPAPGAVLYLPLTIDIENTPYMVQSLEHGRPIVNGYSGQRPAFYSALADSLADFPSPAGYAAIREVDARFVVSASPLDEAGGRASPLVERARLEGGTVYEVRWTPDAIAGLNALSPPPPPPGAAPFAAGEVIEYEVQWEGGPMDVAAGQATLRVLSGGSASRWRFEARAETAAWVSRFFQAQDHFLTTADDRLLPLEHSRAVREGRRQFDRTYIYDRERLNVRVGDSRDAALAANALTLPLTSADARDALTAVYYLRTLPDAASPVSVPINEAGSNLVLDVPAGQPEMLEHDGHTIATVRLEPRLMRRVERRQPIAITVWMTTDARRVPLRVIVEAGFGRIRAELKEYAR